MHEHPRYQNTVTLAFALELERDLNKALAALPDANDAAKLAESQMRHAADVAKDNNQPNRAEFFKDLADRVFWACPVD